MKTFREEVINNLESLKYCDSLFGNKNEALKLDDAIKLIKDGGKYEAMWEKLENNCKKSLYGNSGEYIIKEMEEVKQKYFPKE